MKVQTSVPFNAGEDTVFEHGFEQSLIGQTLNSWTVIDAVRKSSSEILLTLKGDDAEIDSLPLWLNSISVIHEDLEPFRGLVKVEDVLQIKPFVGQRGDIHGLGEG